jgi:hypothetical protein
MSRVVTYVVLVGAIAFTCARAQEPKPVVPVRDEAVQPNPVRMKVAMAPLVEAACERRWQEVRQKMASSVMPDLAIPAVCDPWAGKTFNGIRLRDEGQLAKLRAYWGPKAIHAFIWPDDRTASDVQYRRTHAMLEDLETRIQGPQLAQAREELRRLSRADGASLGEQEDRKRFFALCRLQRRIALADPLLDFSRVLFTGFANTKFVSWAFQACDAIPWPGTTHGGEGNGTDMETLIRPIWARTSKPKPRQTAPAGTGMTATRS